MGKGDKKTKKGKIIQGSYGVKRPRKAYTAYKPDATALKEVAARKAAKAADATAEVEAKPKKKAAPKAAKAEVAPKLELNVAEVETPATEVEAQPEAAQE